MFENLFDMYREQDETPRVSAAQDRCASCASHEVEVNGIKMKGVCLHASCPLGE